MMTEPKDTMDYWKKQHLIYELDPDMRRCINCGKYYNKTHQTTHNMPVCKKCRRKMGFPKIG